MAEAAVGFILNELSRALREEVNLNSGVKDDIKFVRDELDSINSFLRVADAKQEEDPVIKSWVNQVRDVAFDIEDVLHKFQFRVSGRSNGEDRGSSTCLNQVCSSITRWKTNRQIGFRLLIIKSRVKDISERRQRYSYSPTLLGEASSTKMPKSIDIDQLRGSQSHFYGISDHKQELVNWLLQSDLAIRGLALLGMAGFGKTTLAQQIYNREDVMSRFHNRAFVQVSQLLKQEDRLRNMIHQLFANEKHDVPEGIDAMDSDQLKKTMKQLLESRSFFIVLDDVERIEDWNQLKAAIPVSGSGSRVVITTSVAEVAARTSSDFHGKVYNLQPLLESHSWTLFCEKVFLGKPYPPELEPICREVLKKCAGLPLAIVLLSGMLATKDVYNAEVWKIVHDNLLHIDPEEVPSQIMKKIVLYGFYDLPYYLKSCFLLLSVFPVGHSIEHPKLIRLWISEGFVEEKEGETLEEVAEGYFCDLLNRGLVEISKVTTDGRVKSCRIHDFLHNIVLSVSREQSFVAIINKESAGKLPERLRRLSIHNNVGNIINMHELNRSLLWRLHSLYSFEAFDAPNLIITSGCLKLLTVLDLRGASLTVFPEEISSLFLLRYLSLRKTRISTLPASIKNLHNLETLDLKQTLITELPSEVSMLQKLRYLLICYCERVSNLDPTIVEFNVDHGDTIQLRVTGFKATPEIANLVSLQKLFFLEANDELIMKLGKLAQLRKLCLVNLKRQHFFSLCLIISKLKKLCSLTLHITETITDSQAMVFPPLLQRLYLSGNLEKLPSWTSCQDNLKVLHLVCTRLKEDPIKALQALPNLVDLLLFEAYDGQVMNVLPGYFPRVKSLSIFESLSTKRLLIHENAMPVMEQVQIQIGDQWYSETFPLSRNERRRTGRIYVGGVRRIM